jgi:Ni/Co efflux regulator RcnB
MSRTTSGMLAFASALALLATGAVAQDRDHAPSAPARPAPRASEPFAGPKAYQPPREPKGWNDRPTTVDKGVYQHNYRAPRTFRIGVYHRPAGWQAHRWAFGQILPRAYWAAPYILADYWLFGFEVPPAGYEWVRDDDDAILVNTTTGEILQVEYGVFA